MYWREWEGRDVSPLRTADASALVSSGRGTAVSESALPRALRGRLQSWWVGAVEMGAAFVVGSAESGMTYSSDGLRLLSTLVAEDVASGVGWRVELMRV